MLACGSEPVGSAVCWVMVILSTWLWPLQPSERPATSLLHWAGPSHLSPGHTFHIHIWTNWSLVSTQSMNTYCTLQRLQSPGQAGDRPVETGQCPQLDHLSCSPLCENLSSCHHLCEGECTVGWARCHSGVPQPLGFRLPCTDHCWPPSGYKLAVLRAGNHPEQGTQVLPSVWRDPGQ